jgi:hypothetical protein
MSTDVSEEDVASILLTTCYLLHAGFFFGFFFDPQDMFSEKSVDLRRTTWPYIPEDRTLNLFLLQLNVKAN